MHHCVNLRKIKKELKGLPQQRTCSDNRSQEYCEKMHDLTYTAVTLFSIKQLNYRSLIVRTLDRCSHPLCFLVLLNSRCFCRVTYVNILLLYSLQRSLVCVSVKIWFFIQKLHIFSSLGLIYFLPIMLSSNFLLIWWTSSRCSVVVVRSYRFTQTVYNTMYTIQCICYLYRRRTAYES